MNVIYLIISVVFGIICAFLHKNKGYSPLAGFCWGFFFSIIGLAVVLFEKSKEEATKDGLSLIQWLLIFLGIGILLIIIFFIIMNLS